MLQTRAPVEKTNSPVTMEDALIWSGGVMGILTAAMAQMKKTVVILLSSNLSYLN